MGTLLCATLPAPLFAQRSPYPEYPAVEELDDIESTAIIPRAIPFREADDFAYQRSPFPPSFRRRPSEPAPIWRERNRPSPSEPPRAIPYDPTQNTASGPFEPPTSLEEAIREQYGRPPLPLPEEDEPDFDPFASREEVRPPGGSIFDDGPPRNAYEERQFERRRENERRFELEPVPPRDRSEIAEPESEPAPIFRRRPETPPSGDSSASPGSPPQTPGAGRPSQEADSRRPGSTTSAPREERRSTPAPPAPEVFEDLPMATPIPGKEGFATVPGYAGEIDVRGIPPGTPVEIPDPVDPNKTIQFRVP